MVLRLFANVFRTASDVRRTDGGRVILRLDEENMDAASHGIDCNQL